MLFYILYFFKVSSGKPRIRQSSDIGSLGVVELPNSEVFVLFFPFGTRMLTSQRCDSFSIVIYF